MIFSFVLIIGSGSIGERYRRLCSDLSEECYLVSHRKYNAGEFELKTIPKKKLPSILIIASPASSHLQIWRDIGSLFEKVLVEKPIADSYSSAALFSSKNCWIGYCLRFHPLVIEGHKRFKQISLGHIKKIDFVCSSNAKLWREKHYLESVTFNPMLGGGAALELSHEIDLALLFCKELELVHTAERCRDFGNGTVDERWFAKFKSDEVTNAVIRIYLNINSAEEQRFIRIETNEDVLKFDLVHNSIEENGRILNLTKVEADYIYKRQLSYVANPFFDSNVETAKMILKLIGRG